MCSCLGHIFLLNFSAVFQMVPNIRGFSHCLLPYAALRLIVTSSFKVFGVLSSISTSTTSYPHQCNQSLSHFGPKNSTQIFTQVMERESLSAFSIYLGRKPQIALIVFIVLLYWKTGFLLLLLLLFYNLFSTFMVGLLVIWFPKWCLFNLVIISQIHILHSLLLPFISFSLFIIYLRLFGESYFPENWTSFPDGNSPYVSLMFF